MNTLKFDRYTFNPNTLELCQGSDTVDLRPKTAELLRTLINGRDSIVSKRELVRCIWHTEHVTDQSVFQAISELRAQLAPLNAIKTFPNRGYQWVLPVETAAVPTAWRWPAAAAVLSSVVLASLLWAPTRDVSESTEATVSPVSASSVSLPALVAFSEGAAALQRADVSNAIELLTLSVTERPEFTEATLLLAEAHLLNGDATLAREQVHAVMQRLTPQANAYSLIAAMDLLSRTDQSLGQMNSALEWAARAADQANSNGYECTAADLHDRVLALVTHPNLDANGLQASPVFASDFTRRMLSTALAARSASESALAESGVASVSSRETGKLLESRQAGTDSSFDTSSSPAPSSGTQDVVPDPFEVWLDDDVPKNPPAHCDRFRGSQTDLSSPVWPKAASV